jgi:hypothetical protein
MQNITINYVNHGSSNFIINNNNHPLPIPTPGEQKPLQKEDVDFVDVICYIFKQRKIIRWVLTFLLSCSHLNAPSTVNSIPIKQITPITAIQKKIDL